MTPDANPLAGEPFLAGRARARSEDRRPLIAHVVYRFDVGGLENGLANLLNRMPEDRYRHVVVTLTRATHFRKRVRRADIDFVELDKAPGHGIKLLPRLARLFVAMRPAIVHTRNLAALEATLPAWLARVPVRIHGEHGRDVGDLDGSNRTYRLVRRAYRPFVTHWVTVSVDLERYLVERIGVASRRVTSIINGVDAEAYRPRDDATHPEGFPFRESELCVFGTVGRMQPVKNQVLLARAFVRFLAMCPEQKRRARLVVVGEGPLKREVERVLEEGGVRSLAWLPGERSDIADILRALHVFVLPSLAEGISNTILEAMASALPVIAADVGGNGELVAHGTTGVLVPANNTDALACALRDYAVAPVAARAAGRAGRVRAEQRFSLDTMVARYAGLYDRLLHTPSPDPNAASPPIPTVRGH